MKETIADVSSASPSSERSSDEGLALETSAIVSFTAFHYPHQHTVDTPVYNYKPQLSLQDPRNHVRF